MRELLSTSDVARLLGCRPRDISDAFYARILDEGRILIVGGRRAIPADYVPEIRAKLVEAGKLQAAMEATAE
jgi:hypothetical protein